MTTESNVAIIIVNFNGDTLLTACVRSVLASTYPVTVYIIDNASQDKSIHYLQQAIADNNCVHIIKNPRNLGFAAATNLVLSQLKHEYYLLLNPDCFIQADTIAQFIHFMNHYPDVGMAGGLVRNLDGSEQAGCRRSIPTPWRVVVRLFHLDKLFRHHPRFKSFILSEEPLPEYPIEIEGISGACMFVRRQALQVVGVMDESYFLHCEDLDWFMRFRAQNWSILFIPAIEITHVKGACSKDRPFKILWYKHRGMIKFYQKFFRYRYPWIVMKLMTVAIWCRFTVLTLTTVMTHKRLVFDYLRRKMNLKAP